MTTPVPTIQPAGAIRIEVEIEIDAPRSKVWEAFINNTDDWWHEEFYIAKNPARMVMEPKIGGMLYEDCGDQTGFVWGNIQGIVREEYIYMIGYVRPPYGGPCTSLIMYTLEEKGKDQTILKISDTIHGKVDGKLANSLEGGWKMLYNELKAYVEKK